MTTMPDGTPRTHSFYSLAPDGHSSTYEVGHFGVQLTTFRTELVLSIVNGSLCLNRLGQEPDASCFDEYIVEALAWYKEEEFLVGIAEFDQATLSYKESR